MLKGEGGGITTRLLQYVAWFDGGSEIFGFGREGYKESWPWCSLFIGFPSLFVVPSDEQLAFLPGCWIGLSTIYRVFGPTLFSEQSVVTDVEGVGFRPRAIVVGERSCSCMHVHF